MSALARFLHELHPGIGALLKTGLFRVQLETIHPFLDGPGRVGRMMIPLVLSGRNVLREPLLHLSLFLNERRSEKYRLLSTVRETVDWEAWLAFNVTGVARTAESGVFKALQLRDVSRRDAKWIRSVGPRTGTVICAHELPERHVIASVSDVAGHAEVSYSTASTAVKRLEKMGIVRELTGKQRDRLYCFGEYLDIVGEGVDA